MLHSLAPRKQGDMRIGEIQTCLLVPFLAGMGEPSYYRIGDLRRMSRRPKSRRVAVSLCKVAFSGGFPYLEVRKPPARTPGRKRHRFWKTRVGLQPTPQRGPMYAVAGSNLRYRQVSLTHGAFHPHRCWMLSTCRILKRTVAPTVRTFLQSDDRGGLVSVCVV